MTAKQSVTLPSYQIDTTSVSLNLSPCVSTLIDHGTVCQYMMVILSPQSQQDPLVFCLKHPGASTLYFKTETEEQRARYVHIGVRAG